MADEPPCSGCRTLTAEVRRTRRECETATNKYRTQVTLMQGAIRRVEHARLQVDQTIGNDVAWSMALQELKAALDNLATHIPEN